MYDGITSRLRDEGELPAATPVRRLGARWWKVAAAAAVLIAGASAWFLLRQPAMLTASAPAGQSAFVELPDGSRVWLNASSSLEYAGNMARNGRTVRLRGEGYFEVKPDQQQPFVVQTQDLSVQVLGTSFNLKAYEEDAELETALVEGKVAVSLIKAPGRRQLLAPARNSSSPGKTPPGQAETTGATSTHNCNKTPKQRIPSPTNRSGVRAGFNSATSRSPNWPKPWNAGTTNASSSQTRP